MRNPTGFILYRGPSLIDGSPIVVVATGFARRSANAKTGDMVQTYILADGVNPVEAARTGQDVSVCGDCKHRPANGGSCYVTLIHGPSAVHRSLQRGAYPYARDAQVDPQDYSHDSTADVLIQDLGEGRMVRLGTYGDPAAVPAMVWELLTERAAGRTGYTHQWLRMRSGDAEMASQMRQLRELVMASVDSEAERARAQQDGWRTFRVRGAEEPILPREFICPASEEAGKRATCATCGACDGAQRGASKASAVIIVHGTRARRFVPILPA